MALKQRVAVVGLGAIGVRHARLLLERSDVVVEVIEPDARIFAAAKASLGELRRHEHLDALLETKPDVVWLASPTHLHAAQSIAALAADAHVFCEKPMTFSLEEGRAVRAAAERATAVFNVGYYLHFWHGMTLLKNLIDTGTLGHVVHLAARVGTYITLVNSLSRYQARNPGSLFFDYSHQPDLFYWLTGLVPRAVQVVAQQAGDLDFSSKPNVADVLYTYDAPLTAHLHLNYVQMPQRHIYEITGDQAWALLDFDHSTLTVGRREAQCVETQALEHPRDDIFRLEHDAFFAAVAGGRAPETSAADGLVSTAVCAASMQSYETKQKVDVALS